MSSQVRPTTGPAWRLGGASGWTPLLESTHLAPTGGGLGLGTVGALPIPLAEPLGSFGGATLVRGTAISPEGHLLVADPVRRTVWIHRQPVSGAPAQPEFTELWPARELPAAQPGDLANPPHPPTDPYTLCEPVDVAFTPGGELVIADAAAGRLLVLAWPHAALRAVVTRPGWRPVAIAIDRTGRCHVADAAGATIHRFDTRWRHEHGYPHPSMNLAAPWQLAVVASCGCTADTDQGTCIGCGCAVGGNPQAPVLAVLDGTRLVLLDERGRALPPDTVLPRLAPPALQHTGQGSLSWSDPAWPHHDPLEFAQLSVDRAGVHPGTGLPLLAVPRKVRLPQAGRLRLGPFTGEGRGFAWDRLVLDAAIPDGTEILVATLSSDSQLEAAVLDEAGQSWSRVTVLHAGDMPELLVHSIPGRYLWIDIELRGTGSLTPILQRLDIHAPRSSSLNLLPPGYQQEADSADFLDRFLSYFDTVFAEIEAEHRDFAGYLDARTVPAGPALDWLGSWFGLDFEPGWDPATRRQALREAMDYATERGTVPGIQRLLRWHTRLPAPFPAVIEHFRVPAAGNHPVAGSNLEDPGAAHQCTIILPASSAPDATSRQRLTELLARHLPAHVLVRIRYIDPGIILGAQSSLGIDTLLGPVPGSRLGTGKLGIDLATAPAAAQRRRPARSTPC